VTASQLVEDLTRVVDRLTSDTSFSTVEVGFGARDLRVRARNPSDVPVAGLFPAVRSSPAADLYLVDADDLGELRFPENRMLAPYGALLETLSTEWRVLHDLDTGRLLALDLERRVALFHPGFALPPRERAEFCRPLLHWLAILDGNVVVHAGGLARDGRAVLVAGAGNAGKSTLTRVCLESGFDVLGDNVVEVEFSSQTVIHPTYPTFKIRPRPVVRVPDSWPAPEWDDEAEKDIYFLGGQLTTSGPGLHSVTLVLDERGPGFPSPLSLSAAAFRVAPNTVAQFPFFEAETLSRTGRVVASRPTFQAGRMSISEIPVVLAELLATAEAAA
jgi:hypothetical protein